MRARIVHALANWHVYQNTDLVPGSEAFLVARDATVQRLNDVLTDDVVEVFNSWPITSTKS